MRKIDGARETKGESNTQRGRRNRGGEEIDGARETEGESNKQRGMRTGGERSEKNRWCKRNRGREQQTEGTGETGGGKK